MNFGAGSSPTVKWRYQLKFGRMAKLTSTIMLLLLSNALCDDPSPTPSGTSVLGNLYRQARSEAFYGSRYGTEASSGAVSSGTIGLRGLPEHRDAAYYESRCITCDSGKPASSDRGWRSRNRYDFYDDDYMDDRRYRDRYDDYYDRSRTGYDYDRTRAPTYDYDRHRGPAYDYDRVRPPVNQDYDRYDSYPKSDMARPMLYPDRYDTSSGRDRYDVMRYDRNNDRYSERGNGYDNLDFRYQPSGRYDPYSGSARRPIDDPYVSRYDRYNRNYPARNDPYERYDPYYDRMYNRRPYDDRYERYPSRGGSERPDTRGYFSSGAWGPGYERGYASSWNYSGYRDHWREPVRDREPGDNWRDLNRDRDGAYRPRDYFYDSTASPGGSRGTSYLYDRPESSTKADSTERDKPTSSPQSQDNKGYKD